jgi:glucose-6-phosphate 1-dehydrogenase
MSRVIFILFGVTGDLARRKIIPALADLSHQFDITLLGYGRQAITTEEFRASIVQAGGSTSFISQADYIQGELDDAAGYKKLTTKIEQVGGDERLYYLSLPPTLYKEVITQLREAKLLNDSVKLLLEKPFGLDLRSALSLQQTLDQAVSEDQVYRVDHFLGKSAVRSLGRAVIPYRSKATSIELQLLETTHAGDRGALYDTLGASRDMVQNHVLAILAQGLAADPRDSGSRTAFIEGLTIFSACFGQYDGYREHVGVDPDSNTETFVSFEGQDTQGHAINVVTGKALAQRLHRFRLKRKGNVIYESDLDSEENAYSTLLRECIEGDVTYFISWPEVQAQWRVAKKILEYKSDVTMYEAGSSGPT